MIIDSKTAEVQAVIQLAHSMCAAARTAPKTCGIDQLDTVILLDEDKARLADEMRKLGSGLGEGAGFFLRDAENVDNSIAVVLIGAQYKTRGLDELCGACGFANCAMCTAAGATCVYTGIDLGIALGSVAAMAAEYHVDNRIMYSIGKTATAMNLLGDYKLIMGIPLAVSGKSPFFDRA